MNRVFVDMDGVLVNFEQRMKELSLSGDELKKVPGAYVDMPAYPEGLAGVRTLLGAGFEVWIATKPPTGISWAYGDKAEWVLRNLPELKRRIIITHDKGLLGDEGDFLVDDRPHKANCEKFRGTLIRFVNGMTWAKAIETIRTATVTQDINATKTISGDHVGSRMKHLMDLQDAWSIAHGMLTSPGWHSQLEKRRAETLEIALSLLQNYMEIGYNSSTYTKEINSITPIKQEAK